MPDGFAAIATLRRAASIGAGDCSRPVHSCSPSSAVPCSDTSGVQGQPAAVKFAILAFTAGILSTVVVEEIVPEAHEGLDGRLATLMIMAGFSLFAFISAVLG